MAVTITPATVRLDQDRSQGVYLAQVTNLDDDGGAVLYICADDPPADLRSWFRAGYGEFFTFRAGGGAGPTWARTAGDHTVAGNRPAAAALAIEEYRS